MFFNKFIKKLSHYAALHVNQLETKIIRMTSQAVETWRNMQRCLVTET